MAPKTKEQKEKDALALAAEAEKIEADRRAGLTDEERQAEDDAADAEAAQIKADSDAAEAALAAKKTASDALKNKAEEAVGETMYSKSDVKEMLNQAVSQALAAHAAKQKDKDDGVIDLDDEAYKIKKVRLPRFQGKFVTHFKNINTDEYFPDLVITSFNVMDERTKQEVAWVTLCFEDNTELSVPLNTAIDRSQTVWCDLVKVLTKDTSYSQGKVERADYRDGSYGRLGTGVYVNAKIKQAEYTYKLKLPATASNPDGKIVIATRDVVNW